MPVMNKISKRIDEHSKDYCCALVHIVVITIADRLVPSNMLILFRCCIQMCLVVNVEALRRAELDPFEIKQYFRSFGASEINQCFILKFNIC